MESRSCIMLLGHCMLMVRLSRLKIESTVLGSGIMLRSFHRQPTL